MLFLYDLEKKSIVVKIKVRQKSFLEFAIWISFHWNQYTFPVIWPTLAEVDQFIFPIRWTTCSQSFLLIIIIIIIEKNWETEGRFCPYSVILWVKEIDMNNLFFVHLTPGCYTTTVIYYWKSDLLALKTHLSWKNVGEKNYEKCIFSSNCETSSSIKGHELSNCGNIFAISWLDPSSIFLLIYDPMLMHCTQKEIYLWWWCLLQNINGPLQVKLLSFGKDDELFLRQEKGIAQHWQI